MAFVPTEQKPKPATPVGREGALHSEITIYQPAAEEHPDLDKAVSSVPSAKKYLLWFLIGIVVFIAILVYILK